MTFILFLLLFIRTADVFARFSIFLSDRYSTLSYCVVVDGLDMTQTRVMRIRGNRVGSARMFLNIETRTSAKSSARFHGLLMACSIFIYSIQIVVVGFHGHMDMLISLKK